MNGTDQVKHMTTTLVHSRRFRLLLVALVVMAILLGVLIVPVEVRSGRGGNILTLEDGVWWALTTVTGVGFGDVYPVTTTGRVVGVVLETFGVMLFSAVIAMITVEFMRYQAEYYDKRIRARVDDVDSKVEEIKKQMLYLVRNSVDGKGKRS